jgi:hypothetical protein
MKVLGGFRAKLCVELCVEPPYAELRAELRVEPCIAARLFL